MVVREGAFAGGLEYLVFGRGAPLVVLAESKSRTVAERRRLARTYAPLASSRTVYLVTPRGDLPADVTAEEIVDDLTLGLAAEFDGEPVEMVGDLVGDDLVGDDLVGSVPIAA